MATTVESVIVDRDDGETVWTLPSGFPSRTIKVYENCTGQLDAIYAGKKQGINT